MKAHNDTRKAHVTAVRDIADEQVIRLIQGEGLSVDAARAIGCCEIEFEDKNGTPYKGYGLPNNGGGYCVITTQKGTNNVLAGDIAVIKGDGSIPDTCLLFVGPRDAVAFVTMFGPAACDCVVMCSTSLVRKAVSYVDARYQKILYFPPNSDGKAAALKITSMVQADIEDLSAAYYPHKDLRKLCTAMHGDNGNVSEKMARCALCIHFSKTDQTDLNYGQ